MNTRLIDSNGETLDWFDRTYPAGSLPRLKGWFQLRLPGKLLRLIVPYKKSFVVPFADILVVTGFDLVQEVFTRSQDFPTPNNSKTDALDWNPPYLLARACNDDNYKAMYELTREIFADPGLTATLPEIARDEFSKLLEPTDEEWNDLDLGWGYTYPGFLKIVEQYYGVDIDDSDAVKFVCALLVLARFFFSTAKPRNEQKTQDATQAFKTAWDLIEARVTHWQKDPKGAKGAMKLAVNHPDKPDLQTLTSYFLGMIMGFIPTNGNAHARILEVLLGNPVARAWAERYCSPVEDPQKDPEFLAVLHECLRMNYILPGLWRQARGSNLTIGEHSDSPRPVADGKILLVSGMAAMFDPDHIDKPYEFRPDRSYWSYLNYGHQMHFCVGWDISNIIMTEYFRALIIRKFELKPGGKKAPRSMFPWRLDARYRAP